MLMLLLQIGVIIGPLEARTGSAKETPPLLLVAAAFRYTQTSAPHMWLTNLLRPGTYCKTLQLAHNKDWLTFLTSVLSLKGYCEVAEAASCDSKLDSTRRLQIPTIPRQFHFLTRSTKLRSKVLSWTDRFAISTRCILQEQTQLWA